MNANGLKGAFIFIILNMHKQVYFCQWNFVENHMYYISNNFHLSWSYLCPCNFEYVVSSDSDPFQQWEDSSHSCNEAAVWNLKPPYSYTSNCISGWNTLYKPSRSGMEPVSILLWDKYEYIEINMNLCTQDKNWKYRIKPIMLWNQHFKCKLWSSRMCCCITV
jgi:hypothetical protein